MQRVHLIGLDFGTTTSSAVAASAVVRRNAVSARMEICDVQERFRSSMILTPFHDGRLDLPRMEEHLDTWLRQGTPTSGEPYFGGGALLTGLAAQATNAADLIALVRSRLKDALVASADDPRLESWLAFMGNCAGLSQAHPDLPILNLDIGGGTTNLALGLAGEVLATGCLFVGARHFQVVPGTYRITQLSTYAEALLRHLGLVKRPGDELTMSEVDQVLDYYLGLLEAVVTNWADRQQADIDKMHVQVPLVRYDPLLAPRTRDEVITLGGGVGDLVYRHLRGEPWPGATAFGDLGVDLAKRLAASPFWAPHRQLLQPEAGGRATVFGLLRHSTHVSGSTVYLPHPEDLPLRDVPILGTLSETSTSDRLIELAQLARAAAQGACLRLVLENPDGESIKAFALRLTTVLHEVQFPPGQPLVLLVAQNVGKVLGQYVTSWGSEPFHVTVIDEIVCQNAQYANVGGLHDQVIPVSFFGLR